jgi:hypothetical protein
METAHKDSQTERLIARLAQTPGEDVPMPELARVISEGGQGTGICVSRRIYDARRVGKLKGFSIPPPKSINLNGQRQTAYRLEYYEQP